MWLASLLLLSLAVCLILAYSRSRHRYWASRGIPVLPDNSPVFGHTKRMLSKKTYPWEYIQETYRNRESNLYGIYEFLTPNLMVMDPDLAKLIFVKDFDHFVDRRAFKLELESDDIMNHFLTSATGSHWKGIRSMLSPSFTSGRMKRMFPLVAQKADALIEYTLQNKQVESLGMDIRKTFGAYTMEVIASCAFGIESNSFENKDSLFNSHASDLTKVPPARLLKFFLFMFMPKLFKYLKISLMTDSMRFFMDIVKGSITQREAGLFRGDFLDLMLEARADLQDPSSKLPKYSLTENVIVANSVLFILAGFDTTATTLSFFAFLLAKHSEVQERLRDEVRSIFEEHGELTYQGIMEAKYLDACLSEVLRLYAPAFTVERKCTKEYKVPGTDLIIPVDMIVSIPAYSIHHDEKFWPEPEEFQPDRFLPENRDSIKSGTYLPFGVGPRNCIGMRFAQMEVKLVIAKILLSFELECAQDFEQMKLSRQLGIMRPEEGFRVVFKPMEGVRAGESL